jgi:hypothetical protein
MKNKMVVLWAVVTTLTSVYFGLIIFRVIHPPILVALYTEQGHRLIGTVSDDARAATVRAIEKTTPRREAMLFDSGSTSQSMFDDMQLVVAYINDPKMNGNGPSFPVDDPKRAAEAMKQSLESDGFKTEITEGIGDPNLPKNSIWVVNSEAFRESSIVFLLPMLQMPKPPIRQK